MNLTGAKPAAETHGAALKAQGASCRQKPLGWVGTDCAKGAKPRLQTVTVVAPGLLALAADAKILLYGCRARATAAGQALVASPIH